MKKSILYLILISFHFQALAGGGWTAGKGQGYAKLSQNAIIADQFFAPDGEIIDITTISLYTSSLYLEYGITDKLELNVYMPFFVRSTLNNVERRQSGRIEPGDEVNSFGDTDLRLKYQIHNSEKVVIAASLLLGLPLGKTAGGKTKNGDDRILQTGDGEFNQLIMLEASKSFYPKAFYSSIGIGFNNRSNGFSDEFRWSFELGYSGFEDWLLALKIYSIHPLKNGNEAEGAGMGVFGNNIQYISFGPEINYFIKNDFGISGGIGLAIASKNILAAPNYGIGLFKTF
ncbi:MAG: transporter [Cytophagales bacterium]